MNKPKPFILHVIDAICESGLPPDLRHLLMVMAYKANNDDGSGTTGQETLARLIGCNDRSVRQKLERLAALTDAPVRIAREYRQRKDGRGRTSDRYRLVLVTNRQPAAGETPLPTGNRLPLEHGPVSNDQPATECGPTGNPMHDQPATGCQGSTQGSTQMELRSLFVAPTGTTLPVLAAPKRPKPKQPRREAKAKPKAERTPEQVAAYKRTKDFYFECFEATRRKKPVFGAAEGRNVYLLLKKLKFDADAACAAIATAYQSFRAQSVTILNIAANPQGFEEVRPAKGRSRVAPPVQQGDSYDFNRFEVGNAQTR